MNKVTGTTVAAVRNGVNAELEAKAKRFDEVEKENAVFKAAIDQLTADNATLSAAVKKLAEERPAANASPAAELIEVVAVPFEGVTAPAHLVFGGVKYEAEIKSGFNHYKVPQKYAEVLLTDTSRGWPFRLVGRDEPITVKRRVGQFTKDVKIVPHVLDKTTSGKFFWKPVKVEDSK
ncbi:MAG: hypothetical protein LBU70_04960 [Chitinispirillales bacterium]|jgi:hypothetical protein|nr:hypothetical protein [Chitinispirillales bacterium]